MNLHPSYRTALHIAILLTALATMPACSLQPTVAPGAANAQPEDVRTLTEEFVLPDGTNSVRIHNRHGDVRMRFGDRKTVGLYATIQRIGTKKIDPEFRITQQGTQWLLDVRYPGDERWQADGHAHGRVDFGIWLPRDLAVDAETVDGTVQIKRAKVALRVRTQSGPIQVSSTSTLDIESTSGPIIARQESGEWSGLSRVVSESGRILMAVPMFADIHLIAQSGAVLSVDPGMPTPQPAASGGMQIEARLGAALRTLEIRSNQDVHLVPVIRVEKRKS